MSTPLTTFCDRLLVTEFLDALHVWEKEGGEELLSLLRFAARKVGLDRAQPPAWADDKLKWRWALAYAWYRRHRIPGSNPVVIRNGPKPTR